MAAGLRERERLRDLFGRHVGREVAEAALERDGEVELGGELREVAVVFVDVIGSTGLAMRRRPHEVVALLNAFFALVVEVVEQQCGWVNKFEGDAALCVFGAPTARPDAAGDALRAARAAATSGCRASWRGRRPGIGVSAGPAVAGNVGARGALRVHRDRRPRQRGRPPVRAGEAATGAGARLRGRAAPRRRRRGGRSGRSGDSIVLRGRDQPTQVAVPRPRLTAVS